jgi:argininosuccinate synthase
MTDDDHMPLTEEQKKILLAVSGHLRTIEALRFIRDIAAEELVHCPVGTGAEVALRHIYRKATETLQRLEAKR